jgi:Protein of unknown function (DUF2934)
MAESKDLEQRIRERAYLFWIEEGKPEGREEIHWEAACKVIEEENRENAEDGRGTAPLAAN